MRRLQRLEQRLFFWSVVFGTILTLLVLLADTAGFLTPLENWLYDHRARWCQKFTPAPTDSIVHLDIDDKAIDAIGRWPWPRGQFAKMFRELAEAKPKVVGVDVVFSDPTRPIIAPDGQIIHFDDDTDLAKAMAALGNVVSTISLTPRPPQNATSLAAMAQSELIDNLELTSIELEQRLLVRGASPLQAKEQAGDDLYIATRRRAAVERIERELRAGSLSLEDLKKKILPRTDLALKSPLARLIDDQYARVAALNAAQRFSAPLPASVIAPLPTETTLVPLIPISASSLSLGFVDADTTEAVQRSVPLFVENGRRLYPQFGFAFGCRMIGADPASAVVSNDSIRLTSANGVVEIPVRLQSSKKFGRDLSLFVEIPWFGTSEWQPMYDWPAHKTWKNHISLGSLWQIVELRERLEKNNESTDGALKALLVNFLDPGKFEKYAESLPRMDDALSRKPMVDWTLKALSEYPAYAFYQDPANKLSAEELEEKNVLMAAERALRQASEQSLLVQHQLMQQRQVLANAVGGKGVLIGWTATSASDLVTTSLHPRCPGVVVHGVVANAVMTGQWWKPAPRWIAYVLTIIFGISVAVIVGLFRPWVASVTAILLFAAYSLINGYLVFDYGNRLLATAAPLTAIVIVWAGATLVRAIIEGVERIRAQFEKLRLEKEKALAEQNLAVFRHEMELAKTVQVALIPTEPPKMEGIDNCGWNKPADLTGGDCYDLWTIPDGRLGILLADASGHGLAPAMIVSQVRTLVRALSESETHPDAILARVNARVAADLEASRFVTCFLGLISSDGELTWASAGHGPMLWCEEEGGELHELESTALPLGIDGEWMGDVAPVIKLGIGGMLLVMSDGIFEAPDPVKDQFGVERVVQIVKDMRGASAVEITAAIRDAVTKWQQKDSPADDQTTVIIRRIPTGVNVTVVQDHASGQPVNAGQE